MPIQTIRRFIKLEASGGIVLFVAAVLALIMSNSPLQSTYQQLFDTVFSIKFGDWGLSKPLILWVNDGLMAIFFLLVGLEIKRELIEGELSSIRQVMLPGIAAIGGMIGPALFYIALNHHDRALMHGWAIPTATDIAFSLGILALLGKRVPISLKIFLTALAIFDDLGAIIIIAIFYTADISFLSLMLAGGCLIILFILNRSGVKNLVPYFIVGTILWLCVLKSGVHATLAGVALAFAIPLRPKKHMPDYVPGGQASPLHVLESKLHPWVAFMVLPIFAFANAGVSFHGMGMDDLLGTLPLGIAVGLFVGKQVGIMLASWLAIKTGLAQMPRGANWKGIYGIALVCGVGFTMSLFIGTLAFDKLGDEYLSMVRLGVMVGSLLSGVLGYLVLRFANPNTRLGHSRNKLSYR